MRLRPSLLLATLLAGAAGHAADAPAPRFGPWGVSLAAMDPRTRPGDDFFRFVNGSWYDHTQIAPDRTYAGIDSVLNDETDRNVRAIVEDMARNPAQSGRDRAPGRRLLRQLDGRGRHRGARGGAAPTLAGARGRGA